jgi:Leucine-rich repeat (LRR) protein
MRYLASIFLQILFTTSLFAQIDVLPAPNDLEKKEIKKLLRLYNNYIQLMGDSAKAKEKTMAFMKLSKDAIYNNNILVYNDLDSGSKADDYLKIIPYGQKMSEFQKKYKSSPDTINFVFDNIKFDKVRRTYMAEVKTTKKYFRKTSVPVQGDSLASGPLTRDTLIFARAEKLSFFIRFEKNLSNVSRNFKIYQVCKTGTAPKPEPLAPSLAWWMELDEEWKAIFRKRIKMDEYPLVFDIDKVTGLQELNCAGSKIKNLEPLRKFTFLRKLDCSHTAITSIEPLAGLKNLTVLNISFTQISDLKGIEKLTNLIELNCKANKIESIAPLRSLVYLMDLDCSENELDDISPVKDLDSLHKLNVSLNIKVKNIDAVRDLLKLEKLCFDKIDVRTLDPLKKLVDLKFIDCYNTNITTLEPIRHLKKVYHLNLDHNKLTSLEPISNYNWVSELTISSINILDLSDIKNFIHLRDLNCSNNPQLKSLGPIHKFEYVKVLKCVSTGVSKEEAARFKKNHPDCQITYY